MCWSAQRVVRHQERSSEISAELRAEQGWRNLGSSWLLTRVCLAILEAHCSFPKQSSLNQKEWFFFFPHWHLSLWVLYFSKNWANWLVSRMDFSLATVMSHSIALTKRLAYSWNCSEMFLWVEWPQFPIISPPKNFLCPDLLFLSSKNAIRHKKPK